MTVQELNRWRYLDLQIEDLKIKINELEDLATGGTSHITGMPKSPNTTDRMAEYVSKMVDLKNILAERYRDCVECRIRLENYIDSIAYDPYMQTIITLRYVNGLTWNEISDRVSNGSVDPETIRKAHNRFLTKN